jgi:hypothetical protein
MVAEGRGNCSLAFGLTLHGRRVPSPLRRLYRSQEARFAPADRASILLQCETTLLTIVARFGIDSECWEEWLSRKEVPHAR